MATENSEKLLKEIRENYDYFTEVWEPVRREAKKDMRYRAGDPWEPNEREFRVKNDRPVMTWDELSPYINQLVNDPRQNKRAIKINPKGSGATEQTALLRENTIRDIQYNSRAQSAFTTAFQGAAERSYGYFGVNQRLVASNLTDMQVKQLAEEDPGKLFEQELYIYRIPNPDSVLFNPNYKEQDCSDSMECFVEDKLSRAKFKRDFPNAKYLDWSGEYSEMAPGWNHEKEVRVAAYWKVLCRKRKLFLLTGMEDPNDYVAMYDDELEKVQKGWTEREENKKRIKRDRSIETRTVKQYTTNGLEILDESDEIPIPWIPIIPCFGMELWVDRGGGSKRELMSLIRLARDPFMAYCYLRSQEAEEAGLTPRAPVMGYTGQFETDKDAWSTSNKVPRAFLQVDPVIDAVSNQVLPLPTRVPFAPNFQSYEVFAEAARRAIMTAMGGANLPIAAQRKNEKSGVALKEIDKQEAQGTFHFIDNYNFALEHAGRILDAWYPYVYDTKRDLAIREADETHRTIRINDPSFLEKNEAGVEEPTHYDAKTGEHGVTVSVAQNTDSQRDEASQWVDIVVQNIANFAQTLPPGAVAKLLALSIKLKQLGPLGDEMADTISPPADQQAEQQKMQQTQATVQQQQQVIMEMKQELEKLQLEKAGKMIESEAKKQLAQMQNDIKVLVALISTKNQNAAQEFEMYKTFWIENHGAAHDAATQAVDHAHEHSLADKAASNAQATQTADQSHDLALQSATPDATNSGEGAS